MDFLPKDYKEEEGRSNYLKLTEGEHTFRVLSSALVGYEEWIDKKPVRYALDDLPNEPHDFDRPPKRFWAFVVWNVDLEKIQILEITQKTIQRQITALVKSKAWSDIFSYDITIIRTGKGLDDTEYTVQPLPPTPLSSEITSKFKASNIDLKELLTGGDPFAKKLTEDIEVPDDL